MRQLLWGMLTVETVGVALFFLCFWRLSGERLFVYFALALTAIAINWVGLWALDPAFELRYYMYLFRLLAVILIIAGIGDRNYGSRGPS